MILRATTKIFILFITGVSLLPAASAEDVTTTKYMRLHTNLIESAIAKGYPTIGNVDLTEIARTNVRMHELTQFPVGTQVEKLEGWFVDSLVAPSAIINAHLVREASRLETAMLLAHEGLGALRFRDEAYQKTAPMLLLALGLANPKTHPELFDSFSNSVRRTDPLHGLSTLEASGGGFLLEIQLQ